MAAVKASDVISILITADQLLANVARLVTQFHEFDGADEAQIKAQLSALADRNSARYTEIQAALTARATGQG